MDCLDLLLLVGLMAIIPSITLTLIYVLHLVILGHFLYRHSLSQSKHFQDDL